MIPRTLVPFKISPPPPESPPSLGNRRTSELDSRVVVPAELPDAPFDARTSIPAHLPLGVLAGRQLIPRDMPVKRMESTHAIPAHVPLAVLESRVVVPPEAKLDKLAADSMSPPLRAQLFGDVVERDLFTTGELNLLVPLENAKARDWQWLSRSFSLLVHVGVILLILFLPGLFTPSRQETQQTHLARMQLSRVFLPPSVREVPKVRPAPEKPSNRIRLDPRILKKIAPPEPAPLAGPKLEAPPQPELSRPAQSAQTEPAPKPRQPAQSPPAFHSLSQMNQPPPRPNHRLNLDLPRLSPGRELEQSAENALRNDNSSNSAQFSQPMRGGPLPSGAQGEGLLGAGVQILTPTEGVDFSNYLTRMLARIRQNWMAVMPISAQMGDKGVVAWQFRILHNGNLPSSPFLVRTSGKEPLDRAAGAAITASNPFEPLPSAFTGPYIELRIIFLYNLPLDYNYNQ